MIPQYTLSDIKILFSDLPRYQRARDEIQWKNLTYLQHQDSIVQANYTSQHTHMNYLITLTFASTLNDSTFSCSCPDLTSPCKHIGSLLMLCSQPSVFRKYLDRTDQDGYIIDEEDDVTLDGLTTPPASNHNVTSTNAPIKKLPRYLININSPLDPMDVDNCLDKSENDASNQLVGLKKYMSRSVTQNYSPSKLKRSQGFANLTDMFNDNTMGIKKKNHQTKSRKTKAEFKKYLMDNDIHRKHDLNE